LYVCSNGEGRVRVVHKSFYDGITIDLTAGQHGEIVERVAVSQ